MGMPDVVRRWTREEVLALPDDGNRYELIDGELLVSPSPSWGHQIALAALFRRLDPFVIRHRLGTTFFVPADLFVVSEVDTRKLRDWPDCGVPSFIAEILSGARHNALIATLIIGAFHALWHIPLFLVKGEPYNLLAEQIGFLPAFLGYACLVLALSFQLTWIFTNTGGSVLMAAVYHGAGNAWAGYLAIDRGGLAGPVAFVATHLVLALLLVVFFGPRTLSRSRQS